MPSKSSVARNGSEECRACVREIRALDRLLRLLGHKLLNLSPMKPLAVDAEANRKQKTEISRRMEIIEETRATVIVDGDGGQLWRTSAFRLHKIQSLSRILKLWPLSGIDNLKAYELVDADPVLHVMYNCLRGSLVSDYLDF